MDYIFSGDNNQLHVWLGNGDGTFETDRIVTIVTDSPTALTSGVGGTELTDIQDFNNDGVADLATLGDLGATNQLRIYFGVGDGTFQTTNSAESILAGANGSDSVGVDADEYGEFVDINNDGILDYAYAEGFSATANLFTYFGNGDGTFEINPIETVITDLPLNNLALFASQDGAGQSFFIDVTEDGIVDYVTTYDDQGDRSGLTVYVGNGDGTFEDNAITTEIHDFTAGLSLSLIHI